MRRFMTAATRLVASAMVIATSVAPASAAPPFQVNGSGASLFVDFSRFPAATNDWIDCDGDGLWGFYDSDSDGFPDAVDQLAPTNPGNPNLHWIYQYRSVGSVEGFEEFIAYQTCGDLPENLPSERGILNTLDWAVVGVPNGAASSAGWGPPCVDDTDGDGIPNASNTPVCPTSIDLANIDIPSLWATRVENDPQSAWFRKPGDVGYGSNPRSSCGTIPAQRGESNKLASLSRVCGNGSTVSLNTNFDNPDQYTIYDTGIAWSTVATIANRGADPWVDVNGNGIKDPNEAGSIRFSDLQHGFVTGRMKNGENLAFVCRDVGSGTRNAYKNSVGIDPSWGVGDHVGRRINQDLLTRPGPNHQVSNCGGSSISESSVINRRLAIGYTGTVGASRAFEDARGSQYELLGTILDIDGDGDGFIDATQIVRPTLETIINNCDPNTGYRIGGIQTLVTVGNPRAMNLGRVSAFESGPSVANVEAAKFVRNIEESIADFNPPLPPTQFFMPGELLATQFVLVAGVPCLPKSDNPTDYDPNSFFNSAIRDYILSNNVYRAGGPSEPVQWGDVDAGGVVAPANLAPRRRAPAAGTYRDGGDNIDPSYVYYDASNTLRRIGGAAGQRLSRRNQVQGDFNNDGARNWLDIAKLVEAEYKLGTQPIATFLQTFEPIVSTNPIDTGSMVVDRLVVHISGDMNGDGEFDKEDIRYFCDGLALNPTTRVLNRKEGFIRADNAWQVWTGSNNLFGTVLATGATYNAGDSRADIAGSTGGPCPGASPTGADGIIDANDIDYVCRNFVSDWSDTTSAVDKDLSADLNGDLRVDYDDILEIVVVILRTQIGDVNLDGVVDAADRAIIEANLGNPGGWAQGDLNCDGQVTQADLDLIDPCGGNVVGDSNCDGVVNNFDIDCFVTSVASGQELWEATCGTAGCDFLCVNDTNSDGVVNNFDIDSFVNCVVNLGCP